MPIKVADNLPAKKIMEEENIFMMDKGRAMTQEIRPLKIGILNLMPLKEDISHNQYQKEFSSYT